MHVTVSLNPETQQKAEDLLRRLDAEGPVDLNVENVSIAELLETHGLAKTREKDNVVEITSKGREELLQASLSKNA